MQDWCILSQAADEMATDKLTQRISDLCKQAEDLRMKHVSDPEKCC
jgi:hypothetical protein